MFVGALLLFAGTFEASARVYRRDGVHLPSGAVARVHVSNPLRQIVVPVGKSQIVRLDRSFAQIAVGSKDIADVIPASTTTVYVLGKKQGTTNLTLQDANGSPIAVLDVVVTFDIPGLEENIHALMPEERIDIEPAGNSIVLKGQVLTAEHLRQIVALAERYAPNGVTNLLTIGGSQQVLLEVRFAEVQRTAMQDLGVNSDWSLQLGSNGSSISTTTGTGVPSTAFGTATTILTGGAYNFSATLNALEKKGVVRTLANPNLVALSGDTASFLAGGEFPIPVVQAITGTTPTTTIEFKEFGVGLSFTPTIVNGDLINLEMKSEVSAIDPSISVTANGIQVPGLKVRRAHTTVELSDGQSFAIAGLLQDDFNDTVNQIPGLGSIPVLGALFRSINYQHNQTELVVFITAHLVQPSSHRLAAPTDTNLPPSALESFGFGDTTVAPDIAPPPAAPDATSGAPVNVTPLPSTDTGSPAPSTAAAAPATASVEPPAIPAPVPAGMTANATPAAAPPSVRTGTQAAPQRTVQARETGRPPPARQAATASPIFDPATTKPWVELPADPPGDTQ